MIGDHATLSVRYGFNSWRNHLYVRLRSEADGTSVRCCAYMSRIMIAFHVLFAASIIWQFAIIGWAATVAQLILSAAFWSVWIVGGLYLSRREPAELRQIICEVLDANAIAPLPPLPPH
jgi:hypothetical protein